MSAIITGRCFIQCRVSKFVNTVNNNESSSKATEMNITHTAATLAKPRLPVNKTRPLATVVAVYFRKLNLEIYRPPQKR